jgi:DNA-binding IclR family transcriptional regulator
MDQGAVPTTDIALTVLSTLVMSDGLSTSELAVALRVDQSVITEVLAGLAQGGFVFKDLLELYWLGPQLLSMGVYARTRSGLLIASAPVMNELAKRTKTGVALIIREQSHAYRVAFRDYPKSVVAPIGGLKLPPSGGLYTGGACTVLLAYAPQEVIEEVLTQHLHEFSPPSFRTREAVLQLLEQIRQEGTYWCEGTIHREVFSVTAPVRDAGDGVAAVLVISGLTRHVDPKLKQHLINEVKAAAAKVSGQLK